MKENPLAMSPVLSGEGGCVGSDTSFLRRGPWEEGKVQEGAR